MQLTTILNRIQKFQSFVYGNLRWAEGAKGATAEANLRPRKK